ncbi:hemicentin-1-like [Stylophora pistillata]|uniref:hemicentin-1-like n=1 Tax=Stylophora pistillata TaxID=50429 RepID=UPI000C03AE00|nr:hemicentin-1-like [Stylophora pistillata]
MWNFSSVVQLSLVRCAHLRDKSFNWTVQPANPTLVTKGVDLSLTWKFTLTADEQTKSQTFHFIRWTKFNEASSNYDLIGGTAFLKATGSRSFAKPSAPHIKIDRNDQATLLINNVRTEDEGTYKIEYGVEINGTLLANHEVNVTVLEHPEIINASNDQDVCEGSMVTLGCHATGKPAPNITWTRMWENGTDSDELPSVDGNYVISNASKSSNGTYRCKAFNGVGDTANQTVEVIVKYQPSNVSLKTNAKNKVCAGTPVSFECSAVANPLVHTYLSYENNVIVSNMGNLGTVVREMENAGEYAFRCEANNSIQRLSRSRNIIWTVTEPPSVQLEERKVAKEGENISVYCNASGVPPPTVSWRKLRINGDITNGHSLNINNISRCQGGEYICTATNICGTASTTIDIEVQYGPYVVGSIRHVVKEGHCATLFCPVLGKPAPDITWYKGNETDAIMSAKSTLEFHLTSMDVNGWYTCFAKNSMGNVTTSVLQEIDLQPIPKAAVKRQTPKSVESTPTTPSATTRTVPNKGQCPRDDAILKAIIGSLVFIIIVLTVCIVWLYRKGIVSCLFGFFCACLRIKYHYVFLNINPCISLFIGTTTNQRRLEHKSSVYDNEMAMKNIEQSLANSSTFNQPGAEYMDLKETSADKIKSQSADQGADYAALDPSTRSWEVERDHVAIEKIVGKGAFGQVAKGTVTELRGRPGTTIAAKKMLKGKF